MFFRRQNVVSILSGAALVFLALASGCDRNATEGISTRPNDPAPASSDIRVEKDGTRVKVERPGDPSPAVDVKVKPEGGADVNIDRDKIRERIDERRDQREDNK